MALSPLQLQELQDISIVLAEEFPSNVDDIWNTAIRLQLADLGPLGPGGIPTFEAAVADLKLTQEQLQTVQGRNAGPSSGYIEATLEVAPPGGAPFPMGGLGDVLYIDVAPNTYLATSVLSLTPAGPNSVILSEVAAQVARTVAPAAGGIEVNNLLTGAGFERVLTTSDSQAHDAEIVTMALSANLPNERVLTAGAGISLTDGGAGGNATLDVDVIVIGTADGQIPIWDQTTDQAWEPSSLLTIAEAGGGGTAQVTFTMDAIDQLRFYATDGGGIAMAQNTFRMESRGGSLGSAQLAFFSSGGSRALIYNTHSNVLFFDQESSGVTHAQFGYPLAIEAGQLPTVTVDGSTFFSSLASTPMVRQQQDFSYPVADATGACWRFNNPTAASDPGATFMRMNTADFATGTELYFDDLSVDNSQDMAWWFNTLVVGDFLRLHAPGEPDRWLFCSIDSITDNTGWYTIVFTMIDNLGTNFLNGQDVQIQVQKAAGGGGGVTSFETRTGDVVGVFGDYAGIYMNIDASLGTQTCLNSVDFTNFLMQFDVQNNVRLIENTDLVLYDTSGENFRLSLSTTSSVVQFTGSGFAPPDFSLQIQNFIGLDVNVQSYFQPSLTIGGNSNPGSGASINIAPGLVPSVPLDGDVWVTTAGYFARINGVTENLVGGGGIAGSIAINQVAYGSGVDAIQGSANLTFNGNNLLVAAGTFAVQSGTDSITLSCTGGEGFINGTGTTGLMVMTGAPFYFSDGHIFMLQTASALADVAGRGQIWVATTSDGEFMFTDDQGLDMNLSTSLYNNGSKQVSSTALGIQVRDTLMVGGVDGATGTGVIKLGEQASADVDETGYGQIWIQDDPAQRLMVTDESGNDHVVGISGGTVGENVSVNSSRNFNTTDLRADNWIGHYFDGGNNTITLEDNTSTVNWPLYTTINIIAPGSGNQTVVEGAGTTLFDDAGNDTVGGVVVSQGVVSITRQSLNNYIIWGSGWT